MDTVDSMMFPSCPLLQFIDMYIYISTNTKYRSYQTRIINSFYRVFFVTCKKVLRSEHRCFILNTEYISFILAVISTCLYLQLLIHNFDIVHFRLM